MAGRGVVPLVLIRALVKVDIVERVHAFLSDVCAEVGRRLEDASGGGARIAVHEPVVATRGCDRQAGRVLLLVARVNTRVDLALVLALVDRRCVLAGLLHRSGAAGPALIDDRNLMAVLVLLVTGAEVLMDRLEDLGLVVA